MAVMLSTRMLRSSPGGATTAIEAKAGAKIRLLEDSTHPWWKIELLDLPDKPQGWVSAEAINKDADTLGPLDKVVFARECVGEASTYGVNAHYLMAVAELRTNVTDGPNANGVDQGPFALSPIEWNYYASLQEFDLGLAPGDIGSWSLQCLVFAVMTSLNQPALAALIGGQPTPVELYLAQMVGIKAASSALHDKAQKMDALIGGIADTDVANQGIDRMRIAARYPKYSQATAEAALAALATDLQKAVDDTRQLIVQAGADAISSVSDPVSGKVDARINLDSPKIPAGRRNMAELIVSRFAGAGYGVLQQIAALANAIAESNLNPKAKSAAPENSYGLFQLNVVGVGHGHAPEELKDPERNIAIMLDYISKQGGARDAFKAAPSLREAVAIFVRSFERPADTSGAIHKRLPIAQSLLA
jgi:hypothetical protein